MQRLDLIYFFVNTNLQNKNYMKNYFFVLAYLNDNEENF